MKGSGLQRLLLLALLVAIVLGTWRWYAGRARRALFEAAVATDSAAGEVHAPAALPPGKPVPNWPAVSLQGAVLGNPNAPIRFVQFGDYLSPVERNQARAVRALLAAHSEEVAVVYRHYPVVRPQSQEAAVAAACAARQDRFTQAHEQLTPQLLDQRDWVGTLAGTAGVGDTAAFRACVTGQHALGDVEADRAAANAAGVTRTPAFIVEGVLYQRALRVEVLERLLQRVQQTTGPAR